MNQNNYKLGDIKNLDGFIAIKQDLQGKSLHQIESTLGFRFETFRNGAAIFLLELYELQNLISGKVNFDCLGDTRVPGHQFKEYSYNKGLDQSVLNNNILIYLRSMKPELVKIKPLIDRYYFGNENYDLLFPSGTGVIQLKLKNHCDFRVISIIEDYPHGRFNVY